MQDLKDEGSLLIRRGLIGPAEQLGFASRLFASLFVGSSYKNFRFDEFREHCAWMGAGSLPMVSVCAIFIAMALTIEIILESEAFRAQDLSGALIAIGLLRELAALTVSLAWCSKVSAFIAAEGRELGLTAHSPDVGTFFLTRYSAALYSAGLLAIFGLVIGFASAALYAPTLGVTSSSDFLEGARIAIKFKDIFVYCLKLGFINPSIGVLSGCIYATCDRPPDMVVANAVGMTFMLGVVANLIVTVMVYL